MAEKSVKDKTKKKEEKKVEIDPDEDISKFTCRPWAEYISIYTRIPPEDLSYKLPKVVDPKVQELIDKGIELMEAEKNVEAIEVFTEAIKLDDKYALITCNRGACYARMGNFEDALEDIETTCELRRDWPHPLMLKGFIYLEMFRHTFAKWAFSFALELMPGDKVCERGFYEVQRRLQARGKKLAWTKPHTTPFSDKSVMYLLTRHPKTKHLMDEPGFPEILESIRRDPNELSKYSMNEDYWVPMCSAVAKSFPCNEPMEYDYTDMAYPKEAKELREKYASIPLIYKYDPVKELYVPDPPPPKKKERTPFPFFEMEMDREMGMGFMSRHRLPNYDLDYKLIDRKKFF